MGYRVTMKVGCNSSEIPEHEASLENLISTSWTMESNTALRLRETHP